MTWLLWKDYRLNRLIVIVGLVLLVVPHAVAAIVVLRGLVELDRGLFISTTYAVVLTQVVFALLGGNMIACERADRSAEFLAYMPVSKARILASKIVVAISVAAALWLPNLLIAWLLKREPMWSRAMQIEAMRMEMNLVCEIAAVTGLVFFCVGWLCSSILESPTFSICAGLVAPMLVAFGLLSLSQWLEFRPTEFLYCAISIPLAIASFLIGTIYYLRRVEP